MLSSDPTMECGLHPHCSASSERSWRDECGVFGLYAPGLDVARIAYFGIYALQHRGQESAGIATGNGDTVRVHAGLGLAYQVFDEQTISGLTGDVAVGHVRYSTTGGNIIANAQPMLGEHKSGRFAVGHNGNLVNARELRDEMSAKGVTFERSSDTEVICQLIAQSDAETIEEAIAEAMARMAGAYSLAIVTPNRVIGVRDPHGVRPLSIGRMGADGWVLASETCAIHTVGGEFVREVQPGEVVTLDSRGITSVQVTDPDRKACCIFEFIYFARPDSHIYGKSVYMSRVRMGHMLAQQSPVDADIVVPIPETGIPAAIGFSQVSKVPFSEGFIKNRYIFRTFINPDQRMRDLGVRMKLTPLREALAGRRVIVVDDSIVRGTTTAPEVDLLREAGAREVHLRICCPPIKYPCFYGIDTSNRKELIAARMTPEEICEHVGADSLHFLDMKGLVAAVGLPKGNFCTACFDRSYPIPIPREVKVTKFDLEEDKTASEG